MRARIPVAVLMMSFLTACAGPAGKGVITPVPDPESPGARLYTQRCSTCHALPHPRRLGFAGWTQILPLMERRMAERGMAPLTDEERRAILAYLHGHAR